MTDPETITDPYADCRLAIEIHQIIIHDAKEKRGKDVWDYLRLMQASPMLCRGAFVSALNKNRLNYPDVYAGIDLAEVNRQMQLPSFLRWIAGNLGAA